MSQRSSGASSCERWSEQRAIGVGSSEIDCTPIHQASAGRGDGTAGGSRRRFTDERAAHPDARASGLVTSATATMPRTGVTGSTVAPLTREPGDAARHDKPAASSKHDRGRAWRDEDGAATAAATMPRTGVTGSNGCAAHARAGRRCEARQDDGELEHDRGRAWRDDDGAATGRRSRRSRRFQRPWRVSRRDSVSEPWQRARGSAPSTRDRTRSA